MSDIFDGFRKSSKPQFKGVSLLESDLDNIPSINAPVDVDTNELVRTIVIVLTVCFGAIAIYFVWLTNPTVSSSYEAERFIIVCGGFSAMIGAIIFNLLNEQRFKYRPKRTVAFFAVACLAGFVCWGCAVFTDSFPSYADSIVMEHVFSGKTRTVTRGEINGFFPKSPCERVIQINEK